MIEINTARLKMKPVQLHEAADVAALMTEKMHRWTSQIPWPYSIDDAKHWIRSNQPWARLGIYLSGELIGTICMPIADEQEIGFVMSALHENKGYTTEAARAVIDYAFDNFALRHISSSAHPENIASRRVHEKLGFAAVKETTDYWPNKKMDMKVILYKLEKQQG